MIVEVYIFYNKKTAGFPPPSLAKSRGYQIAD